MKKFTIPIIIKKAHKIRPEDKLLSTIYVDSRTQLLWCCKNNHEFPMSWDDFKQLKECKYCAKDKFVHHNKLSRQIIIDSAISCAPLHKLLSEKYIDSKTPLLWLCPRNHEYKMDWNNFDAGKRCKWCAIEDRRDIYLYTIDIVREKAKKVSPEITLIDTKYEGAFIPLLWKCDKEHEYEQSWATFSSGRGCPECNIIKSCYEKRSKKIFEELFEANFPTKRPSFLRNPETGRNLELDGYNKDLKLAFEYDGEQHYINKMSGRFKGQLPIIQKRDKLKTKLCKENNITLIRIPYWEYKNLKEFIKQELSKYPHLQQYIKTWRS